MSADFWAGYVSGAIGILIGNPLDIIKTKLQAGSATVIPSQAQQSLLSHGTSSPAQQSLARWTQFARGAAAPILGYGALNAVMFMTYNRSLSYFHTGTLDTLPSQFATQPEWWKIWSAGALGGLATFFVSTPTELVKCRAQVSHPPRSSWQVTQELWRAAGVRGLYMGGTITAVRDSVGYGFYFWSYELSKRAIVNEADSHTEEALKVLLCGGLAGVITWASIFPLDVVKTRVQTWDLLPTAGTGAREPLLGASAGASKAVVSARPSTSAIAMAVYRKEGAGAFFRGLGVCSARAFIVNAAQWAVYEWMMKTLTT
ncbi:Putative mitochondrial carrier protein [Septoria linicola]|uniref:Mitochondrial carrier protein n=1 Tax=Septoria linicola TaxID=215465 RepID=A0A9Q9AWI2_9PEZI|nr:putative mitochondrial carrier protein [Septoria linicola]USW56435.1 Putative mitochondrial carrier protein [Septoria linicola]